jgi:cation diffusion facilitator family transporter
MEGAKQNIRVQLWVAILSVALLLTKLVAFILTGSVAILTDALESIVNVVAGFFGLFSLYLAAKPRDADHPYGHGKIEFVSSAVEGSMIFIAGTFIIYEATANLIHPSALRQLDLGIMLIGATAILNFIAGTICVRIATKNNSQALLASGKHLKSDTYSTAGILIGLILIHLTNIMWIDSVVAILFSFIILYTGYKIIRSSLAGIMDEVDKTLLTKMVTLLNKNRKSNWIDLHNLRIIKYGSVLHIDCHLTLPWYLNLVEAHEEVDALSELVRKNFGESVEFFVHTDPCLEFSCKICDKHECQVRKDSFKYRIDWTVENVMANKKHGLINEQVN